MSDHAVYLIGGDDDEMGSITYGHEEGVCKIAFYYRDRTIEASASDYFDAFSLIRTQIEQEGLIPFCYGASLNVFPSGMCRDMGSGLSAYRLTNGQAPERADLVNIFDSGHDVIPASVKNQKAFYSAWLQSMNRGSQ